MALGGGAWLTQNKVLPGSYINFSSVAKASATITDRGYVAAPFALSWGPENKVFAVTADDFQKNSKVIFGYAHDHPKMMPVREIFLHATTVYCYRLGTGAHTATCVLADARYPGVRGNDLTIVVEKNVDNEHMLDVSTVLDGIRVDTQTVSSAAELVPNDFVAFKTGAELSVNVGVPLTGGTDVSDITGDTHQAFLDAIESYAFNILCCPAADSTTVQLYSVYTKRLRDELGAKFQLVAWQPKADYEGVIGVWNTATHNTIKSVDQQAAVYWVAGAQAGVEVNKSLTNAKYDGELNIDTKYTQVQLEAAIKAGKFMFHSVNGDTRVLEDINTLLTINGTNTLLTIASTKGDAFQSNQTVRVCDQIANDIAVLFNTKYLGAVPNDAAGRAHLWGNIVKLIQGLEKIRAVENFDPDTVTCTQGDNKKAVLCTIEGLNITNAMSQLYMSVIVK